MPGCAKTSGTHVGRQPSAARTGGGQHASAKSAVMQANRAAYRAWFYAGRAETADQEEVAEVATSQASLRLARC